MRCVFAVAGGAPAYVFSYVASPFWFAVARTGGDGDTIFNSSSGPLVFKVCRAANVCCYILQQKYLDTKAAAQRLQPLCLCQLLSGAK